MITQFLVFGALAQSEPAEFNIVDLERLLPGDLRHFDQQEVGRGAAEQCAALKTPHDFDQVIRARIATAKSQAWQLDEGGVQVLEDVESKVLQSFEQRGIESERTTILSRQMTWATMEIASQMASLYGDITVLNDWLVEPDEQPNKRLRGQQLNDARQACAEHLQIMVLYVARAELLLYSLEEDLGRTLDTVYYLFPEVDRVPLRFHHRPVPNPASWL